MFNTLRGSMTLIFVSLAVAPIVIVSLVLALFGLSILQTEAVSAQHSIANLAKTEISALIDTRINQLRLITSVRGFGSLGLEEQTQVLNSLLAYDSAYKELGLLDAQGQEVLRLSEGASFAANELISRADEDLFLQPVTTQDIFVSPVEFDQETGELLLTIALPNVDLQSGRVRSVLTAKLRFRSIWELLARAEFIDANNVVYMVDSSGDIVAHPNSSVVLRGTRFDLPPTDGAAVGLSGESVILAREQFQFGAQGFTVVAERNAVDALALVYTGLWVVAIVTGFALVAVALALLYLVRRIVFPIERLSKTAQEISGGKLVERAVVTGPDELGKLAESFNSMVDQIQAQLAILEDQLLETEEARADAVRSDQVKSAFLASMSHELRTPLNAVINFTRFVIDGDTGPVNDEQTELLTQVVASARHLLNLINDVLDMSKIEAGALNLFVEDNISLNTLLKSAAATGQSLLVGKPVRLRTEVEDNLPLITGDRQRMLQILLNIVSNACKFTDEGEIIVRARKQNEEIVISVSDTGPGISQEDQLMVFEAFKQTNSGLRQGGGTGLGMPIARSLAEAHGGRLWLESEFGKGANFYVAFPVKSEALVAIMA